MSNVEVVDQLVMIETTAIKPYFRNPRKNEKTVAKLVELIPRVGFNVPLVLDRENVIVKGHARWTAAIQLKMPELPCVYTDADPDQIRLDRLADNRIAEFSQWEEELLKGELTMLSNAEFDEVLRSLEYTLAEPAAASTPKARDGAAEPAGMTTQDYTEVTCNKCGNTMFVKRDDGER